MPKKDPANILPLPEGLNMVRFLFCDTGGLIRGKVCRRQALYSRIASGIGLVRGAISTNIIDQMQSDTGYDATGEVRLVPDLSTFRMLPYCPGSALLLCDLFDLNKKPWALCPRQVLKRRIKACLDNGIRFEAAFEPEFYLGQVHEQQFVPIDKSNCFSSEGMHRAATFIDDFASALESQGMKVELYYPELGHGQHELSIKHSPALQAADNQILYRETLRGVAQKHGLAHSLAPKPLVESAGSGCHLHISAWDNKTNRNLFCSETGLSEFGQAFIAGLLHHLPALVGITCPTVNSYQRLKPKAWSSAYTCWGYENREAAVRVPSVYWNQEEETTNLELKCVDSSTNPYLALSAVIACGMDGVTKKMVPPEPISGDPSLLNPREAAAKQVKRLPSSLADAVKNITKDPVIINALGNEFTKTFIAVKNSESAYFAQLTAEEEAQIHFNKF